MPDRNCLFCKIVRGDAAAIIVYQDPHTLAFMDIYPASLGHTLIVSKEHAENLLDLTPPALAAVSATTQRLARALYQALAPDGLRVMQFNGAAAGQTVFHYHVHCRPAYRDQSDDKKGSHGRFQADSAALEATAQKIRAALSQ